MPSRVPFHFSKFPHPQRIRRCRATFGCFVLIPGLFAASAAQAVSEGSETAGDSYRDFIRSYGLEVSDEQARPDRRLHTGGPRNVEAFALGYSPGVLPAVEERPRVEQDDEGRLTLVYPVAPESSAEVRVQPVYTINMSDWRSDGVTDEPIGHRGGRQWRRAIFPEPGSRHFAVALRIDYTSGESGLRPLASDDEKLPVAMDHQSACCSVVTDPVGFVVMYAYGGNNDRRSYSALSVPMLRPAVMAGAVQHVEGNRLVVSGGWNEPKEFGPTPSGRATHFIEVRNGAHAGRMVDVVEWDGESLLLIEDVEELGILSRDDRYQVREHWTLDSFFFFASPDAEVHGSTDVSEADQAMLFDPATQQFETFWYWSDGEESGWRDHDGQPADDVVVYPARGLVVSRAHPEDLDFIVLGEVRVTPLQAEVLPGFNVLPNPFPVRYTLDETGLRESGLSGGAFQEVADSIQAPRIGGGFDLYWLSTMEGTEGYVDFKYQSAGDTIFLQAGQGFVLQRKGEQGFWWTSPVPYFLQ